MHLNHALLARVKGQRIAGSSEGLHNDGLWSSKPSPTQSSLQGPVHRAGIHLRGGEEMGHRGISFSEDRLTSRLRNTPRLADAAFSQAFPLFLIRRPGNKANSNAATFVTLHLLVVIPA